MIPYGKLYIYEIDGRISRDENRFPADYIGNWWEGEHSYLFFSQERRALVGSILESHPSLRLVDRFTIDYRSWQGGDEISPFRIGRMLFIPPWEEVTPLADDIPILLDPCVVFGSGLHPTTRGCLKALWEIYQKDRPQTVLDLGTGTGILALACAKLGAEKILAIDYNPLAVKTAEENVRLNCEERRIHVKEGRAEDLIRKRSDLACCNLHYQVLEQLLNTEAFFQKRWSILSGFFERESDHIARVFEERRVHFKIISQYDSWQTILGFNPKISLAKAAREQRRFPENRKLVKD